MRAICLILILLLTGAARSESIAITNVAGRVLVGELVGVTDHAVRLRLAGGTVREISLTILKEGEAARIRAYAGIAQPPAPAITRIKRNQANQLARIDARVAAGTLSAEVAARKRAEINTWAHLQLAKIQTEETR